MTIFAYWISISTGICLLLAIPQNSDLGICTATDRIENMGACTALLQRKSRLSEKAVVAGEASAFVQEEHSMANDNVSFLHQVVGMDGVLMISLARDNFERFNYSQSLLRKVGITPTKIVATDANDATPQVLLQGCLLANPLESTSGCVSKVEQAIAESHRQALTMALHRENELWTAVFEDDTVPVLPESGVWDSEFKRIWSQVPREVGMIRLGWCEPQFDVNEHWGGYGGNWTDAIPIQTTTGANTTFMWNRTASRIGGCTTAYIVHKRIIPDLLRIFPCHSALDSCLEWEYYSKNQEAFINLDVQGSVEYIQQHGDNRYGVPRGVVMQAYSRLGSTRHDKEGHPMLISASRGG